MCMLNFLFVLPYFCATLVRQRLCALLLCLVTQTALLCYLYKADTTKDTGYGEWIWVCVSTEDKANWINMPLNQITRGNI